MKKIFLLLSLCLISVFAVTTSALKLNNSLSNVNALAPEYKTISEIGNPLIAGTSYYDDGTLFYTNTGSTVGYCLDHSNIVFDFDITFNQLAWPSWFSLTLKANGFDRTQSPNLTQKGYSFVFFPAGEVQVWKNGATITSNSITPINTGVKYNYKVGAINNGNKVSLTLLINNKEVINFNDVTDAYLTGDWFNICSDGAVNAELVTTKPIVIPNYYTYTLSTLKTYPIIANTLDAKVDKYNNINILSSGSCVGFNQALKDFSLEMNFNFSNFFWAANFLISCRSSGFNRVDGSDGYSFRIRGDGSVAICKQGVTLGSGGTGVSFDTDKNYIIEVGAVDINENSTNLFVKVNNSVVVSVYDNDNPVQNYGWINMNGDGAVACNITSSNSKLNPLQTIMSEDENYKIYRTYLQNSISYKDLNYENFDERFLKAILIDGENVVNFNKNHYTLIDTIKNKAVMVKTYNNVLEIKIAKNLYLSSTNELSNVTLEKLTIKKTAKTSGIICPTNYVLKTDYSFKL